jgi:hypothetical protein
MNYIPPRYSRRSVYRFVPILQKVCDSADPVVIKFYPHELGLTQSTAIARLRDAKAALSTGMVTHPFINVDRLKALWPKYKISTDADAVLLTPRTTEQTPTALPFVEIGGSVIGTLHTDEPEFDAYLRAFAVLLGGRHLSGSLTILGKMSSKLIDDIHSQYDVAIQQQTQNHYIML